MKPLLGLLAFCLALVAVPHAAHSAPPNVVYLISDDHAWTDYGFMGHQQIETPNLDKLAARSALFSRGYVPTALCRPALMTFANGLYSHQHKTTGNDPTPLPSMTGKGKKGKGKGKADAEPAEYAALREQLISHVEQHPTIAGELQKLGYLTFQSGKWWEGSPARGGFTAGMTRGFPQPGGRHGDDGLKVGREGLEPVFGYIDQALAAKKPFFLWYAPMMPHTPHTPPDRLFQKYKAKGIKSDHVARYYAMVEWFDETCGQLIDKIEEKGLTENTIFVYVADNGWIQDPNSQGYAPRSKQSANEGGTRQPILFSWPQVIQPGNRGEQLCSSIDIMPTVLAAVGAEIPKSLPGLNLLPVLKSGEPTPRKEVFGETFAHDVVSIEKPEETLLYRWVVDGKWKLLLTYDGKLDRYASSHPRTEKRPQLFDLLADPHEDVNLAAQNPEVVQRLADKLQAWWPVTERQVLTKWTDEPGVWRE
ncbi:sulfatase family protein [Prosthecobacter dejongeii]|uniref:Putative sulfatase n=1 Tax=Prosthecobacter dejongeii TaxID=48465 RepID=A0A7W7YJV0_9BACT|nr:sulfatase [Prosthecobacter dejongeii]MBB5037528.1 putative sulfatase [Prosthecobacter dejongeii]